MKCINCKIEINKRNKFCSIDCQKQYQFKNYIEKWKNNEVDAMRGEYQISSYIKRYMGANLNHGRSSRKKYNK